MRNELKQLDFSDDESQTMLAEARIGANAAQFLRTEIGRLLSGRASVEIENCKLELLDLDPDDPNFKSKFAKVKARAACAQAFVGWMSEVIQGGDAALAELEHENEQSGG